MILQWRDHGSWTAVLNPQSAAESDITLTFVRCNGLNTRHSAISLCARWFSYGPTSPDIDPTFCNCFEVHAVRSNSIDIAGCLPNHMQTRDIHPVVGYISPASTTLGQQ